MQLKSNTLPEFIISSVKEQVSGAVIPFKYVAIRNAET